MSLRVIPGGEAPPRRALADYIWADGSGQLMTKRRAIEAHGPDQGAGAVPILKPWTFSVRTQDGGNQTLLMSPCHYLPDPLRPQPSFLILCEIRGEDGRCHFINVRSQLREKLDQEFSSLGLRWGFRQTFSLTNSDKVERPVSQDSFIAAEKFLTACLDAGIYIHSAQIDNPSGTWSFKVGHRGFEEDVEAAGPLLVSDHVMLARYLLQKVAQDHGLDASFGTCSCFLSTSLIRDGGKEAVEEAARQISANASPNPLIQAHVRLCLSEAAVTALASGQPAPGNKHDFIEVQGLGKNVDPYAAAIQILGCLPTPN